MALLPLGIGAVSYLLVNLILKEIWDATEYGKFSLLMTMFSMINAFGLLGTNHALLRIGSRKPNDIFEVPSFTRRYLFLVLVIVSLSTSFVIVKNYLPTLNFLILTVFCASSLLIVLQFNIERINSNFIISQFITNSWRTLLLISLLVLISINHTLIFEDVYVVLVLILSAISGVSVLRLRNTIRFKKSASTSNQLEFIKFSTAFLLNMATLTFLNYGVNLIIQAAYGLEVLGKYFFIATIFLYPFNLMATYVGFKELVYFKSSFNLSDINKKIIKTLALGLLMSVLILALAFLVDFYKIYSLNLKENSLLIIVTLLIGLTKIVYSLFSSVLGAQGDLHSLYRVNIISIFFAIFISILTLVFKLSLNQFLIGVLVIWVVRSISIKVQLPRLIKNASEQSSNLSIDIKV